MENRPGMMTRLLLSEPQKCMKPAAVNTMKSREVEVRM